jgi:hypothetical protein
VQLRKQDSEIVSIDEGRQIDSSDEQSENADSPRSESLDPLSNVKVARHSHDLKQELEIVSIEDGIQID